MKKIHFVTLYGGYKMEDELEDSEKHFVNDRWSDNSMANRLLYWNDLYHLTKYHNFEYKIYVEKKWWPELEYINLPNTISFDYGYTSYNNYINEKEEYLRTNKIKGISNFKNCFNSDFKNIDEWYTDYLYAPIYGRKIQEINFKNKEVNNYIKNKCKELVGIHIRRGNGVDPPELNKKYKDSENIEGVTRKDDMELLAHRIKYEYVISEHPPTPPYVPNEYYINKINSILEKNPNEKFFISHDVNKKFIKPIIDRFKNKIITSEDIIYDIESIVGGNMFKTWPYNTILTNLVDMFCLISCKLFIPYEKSSWSEFVINYNNKYKLL